MDIQSEEYMDSVNLAQEKELEYRLNRYNRGETKFYDWETVEQKLQMSCK